MSWDTISALMTTTWRIEGRRGQGAGRRRDPASFSCALRPVPCALLFVLLAACGTAPVPTTRTTVDGVVVSEGLTMPGVRVTISAPGQPASSVLSDGEGRYAFTVMAPATYELEAELPGFETLHRRIRVTEPVSIELQLALTGSGPR